MARWDRAVPCVLLLGACGGSPIWLGGAEALSGDAGGPSADAGVDLMQMGSAADASLPVDVTDANTSSFEAGAVTDVDGAPLGDAACGPKAIVTGAKSPTSIAVDDDGVFWSEEGHAATAADPNAIMQAAKDGSSETRVVPISGVPGALALDAGFVYYLQGGTPPPSGYTVLRDGKPGKPASTRGYYALFASPAALPGRIAVSANRVAWVDAGSAYTATVDAVQGVYNVAASNLTGGSQLVLESTAMWVSEQTSNVLRIDLTSPGLPAPVSGSSPSFGVAADSTRLYWTSETAVLEADKAGGVASTIASCATSCDAIETDGTSIFWATTHEVWEAPAGGGSARKIGEGYGDVRHIAIDATHIYWTDTATGIVWSACK